MAADTFHPKPRVQQAVERTRPRQKPTVKQGSEKFWIGCRLLNAIIHRPHRNVEMNA